MIKALLHKIVTILKDNYVFILFVIMGYLVLTFPLPYYIHTAGGLIDISKRVQIENEYTKEGTINLSYVTEIDGSVITYLLSFVFPNWDLVKKEEYVSKNESVADAKYRNNLMLEEANANAMMVAYREAGKEVNISDTQFYIVYIDEGANTDLQIKDEIISIEGMRVVDFKEYISIVRKSKVGDNLGIEVIDKKGNRVNRKAKVFEYDNTLVTGIIVVPKYSYSTNPQIEFNFRENESGASGGLMMALAIYNKLVKDDLTKGNTIVGTGTIDIDGNVGPISGIEYKLKGAVKAKADIFLVPMEDNYEEALEIVKKNNYNIKLIGVSTFRDALNYLSKL